MVMTGENENTFESYRPLMFAIAYRMLGSAMDAEDIVQEAFLRYQGAHNIEMPKAFLTTVVTRLCLDYLKSARVQRESYVGPWLPEPVLTSTAVAGPAETVEQREDVSIAVMTLLERLGPEQRVVYVLRE